jgi:predicted ATPase/class 3 adenylate cyclase
MAAPSGTVTFLFTDVAGSTKMWEDSPEAMRRALERHDAIVRSSIESWHGHVFSTAGDAFGAAFSRASDAVGAALSAQSALSAEPWSGQVRISVRMGLHTGEATERDGDYFGSAVNRAARIEAIAHGGQVLCSDVTASLAEETSPVVDLGEHRLRDLSAPQRIFQIGVGTFPPLHSLDSLPTNLPAQASSFVGRDLQLAEVAAALEISRVVTLTGVGGVGKTRLAVQTAADLLPTYRDGAWLVELAPAVDRDAFIEVVAMALGVDERQGQSLSASVSDFLRQKRLLMVLDNCEHLLDVVAVFASEVVADSPHVGVLATSREGLGIPGERILVVRSLGLPGDGESVEAVGHADAVRLFVERATETKAEFELTDFNAEAVAQLVRRLDGIPLAIELAAARVRSLTPAELATRVDERFRLLAGGKRTAVERHQTLRRAIDWSYELLAPAEQAALNRMAVFAADVSLETAEAVITGEEDDRADVVDLLGRLVDKSLLVAEDRGATTRYRLLETIRQYAQERLEDTGEAETLRHRYATFCADFAEAAGEGLRGPDEAAWTERVEVELDHLRSALAWSIANGEVGLAMRLVAPLAIHGSRVGYAAGAWPASVVTMPKATDHPHYPSMLAWTAYTDSVAGKHDQAVRTASQALDAAARLGAGQREMCRVLASAGPPFMYAQDFGEARRHAERWMEEAQAINDDWELTLATVFLSAVMNVFDEDKAAALALTDDARDLARRLGNPTALCYAGSQSGMVRLDTDQQSALEFFTEALEAAESVGNQLGIAMTLGGLAWIRIDRGEWREAAPLVLRFVQIYHRGGDHEDFVLWCPEAVFILQPLGDEEAAATVYGVARAATHDATTSVIERLDAAEPSLRTHLGAQRFEACVSRGNAMDDDELATFISERLGRIARVPVVR